MNKPVRVSTRTPHTAKFKITVIPIQSLLDKRGTELDQWLKPLPGRGSAGRLTPALFNLCPIIFLKSPGFNRRSVRSHRLQNAGNSVPGPGGFPASGLTWHSLLGCGYSSRKASIGSIREARQAGNPLDTMAAAARQMGARVNVTASVGVTPNNKDRSACVVAREAPTPNRVP